MIIGIGTDIVDISRIQQIIQRYSDAFLTKIFTEDELEQGKKQAPSPQFYAGRWAVKEAVSKALGCGIGENCYWHDITTFKLANGRPMVKLSGQAACYAASIGVDTVHVSITHDKQMACAFVVLERTTGSVEPK